MKLQHLTEEQFKAMQEAVRSDVSRHIGHPAKGGRPHAVIRQAPNPVSSPYRSKWDAAFAGKLELEKRAGVIKDYAYENLTFRLAHRQYHRNDFLIWHLDGSIEIAQVKGYHKNMRAGIKGLKWAAKINPWFTWTLKRWTGTGWDSTYVEA